MAKNAKVKKKSVPDVQARSAEAATTKSSAPNAPKSSKWDIIDKSKAHNIITPAYEGATMSQRGSDGRERFYNQEGRRVWLKDEPPDPAGAGLRAADAPAAAPAPVKETASATPPAEAPDDPEDIPADEKGVGPAGPTLEVANAVAAPPPAANGKDDDVNLTAWATVIGVKYRWGEVRDAINARYSKVVTNQSDALAFLIEQGVANSDQVAAKWAVE
jgi:hypothetical protein